MTFEDIAHGLVTDRITQIGQRTHNAIVAPRAIVLGQPHHQGLQLRIDRGAPWCLPFPGAVKFLRDELPVPGEDGVGLDDAGHLLQGLFPELHAECGQGFALTAAQPDTAFDLLAQYPVVCHQIRMAQAQFLIDGSRDIRQQCLSIHTPCPLRLCRPPWASSMPDGVDSMQAEAWTMARSSTQLSSWIRVLRVLSK
jgi:hypothetical protein